MKVLVITLGVIVIGLLGLAVFLDFRNSQAWDGFSCAINSSTVIHDTGSVRVYNAGKEYVVEKEGGPSGGTTTIKYIFSERPALCIMKRVQK